MQNEGQRGRSDRKAPDDSDAPAPEQGSPGGNAGIKHDDAAKRIEKGKENDSNPLAPPINTQAGS